MRAGEYFLSTIANAVMHGPAWSRTLLVVTFDEWGGFYDHVPPPAGPDVDPRYMQRGFRVPCLLISPFARRGHVAHDVYDHTSILRLIEWRWGLDPLSVRDAAANEPRDGARLLPARPRGEADRRPAPRRRGRLPRSVDGKSLDLCFRARRISLR